MSTRERRKLEEVRSQIHTKVCNFLESNCSIILTSACVEIAIEFTEYTAGTYRWGGGRREGFAHVLLGPAVVVMRVGVSVRAAVGDTEY